MAELWQRCLRRLEGELNAEDLHTWLVPLQPLRNGDELVLYAANVYVAERVQKHFIGRIGELLHALHGSPVKVQIKVGQRPGGDGVAGEARQAGGEQLPSIESNLDSRYTFENFVEGKSNELGKAAALQVALKPGEVYNPLLLYGGTGLGKTHLLHAAGNLMRQNRPGTRVVYMRSERFVSEMIRALRSNRMDEFKRQFRSIDALLID